MNTYSPPNNLKNSPKKLQNINRINDNTSYSNDLSVANGSTLNQINEVTNSSRSSTEKKRLSKSANNTRNNKKNNRNNLNKKEKWNYNNSAININSNNNDKETKIKSNHHSKNEKNSETSKNEISNNTSIIYQNDDEVTSNSYINNKKNENPVKIPIVPRENLKKYINSRIIFTKKELIMLKKKISNNNIHKHVFFDLLYRASIDGDYQEIINTQCENLFPRLVLFYSYEGARFGYFLNKKKVTHFLIGGKYKEIPGTSFLISLNHLKIYDIKEKKIATDEKHDNLCFGKTYYFNKNGSNWLINIPNNQFLAKKCLIGNKQSEFCVDVEELVGPNKEYHLKDVEIFHVVIEVEKGYEDKDDKKKKKKKSKSKKKDKKKKKEKSDDSESESDE